MFERCMCGDPACPSCGPAQGYCPKCVMADREVCTCDDFDGDPDTEYDRIRQEVTDNGGEWPMCCDPYELQEIEEEQI